MIGSLAKCCCTPPTHLEEKRFRLYAPYPGYAEFSSAFVHKTTWVTTKYLVRTKTEVGGDGLTRTTTNTYDQDSGKLTTTVVTDTGFTGPSGSVVSTTYDATTSTETRDSGYTETVLSSAYDFDDFVSTWNDRIEDLMPLGSLHARSTFTGHYPSDGSSEVTRTFEFASIIDAESLSDAVSEIWIKPRENTPWDGTYRVTLYKKATAVSSDQYEMRTSFGGTAFAGDLDSYFAWDSGNSRYYTNGSSQFVFERCCISMPQGMNCDVSGFTDGGWDYQIGDVALIELDPDTGIYSVSNGELELAVGKYSFDGRRMHIAQGSKLNPSSALLGIDESALGSDFYYGLVLPRREDLGDPDGTDPRIVTDYCPP